MTTEMKRDRRLKENFISMSKTERCQITGSAFLIEADNRKATLSALDK